MTSSVYCDNCFLHTKNECEIENGGCEQICSDRIVLYECSCMDGYEINEDNHTCRGKSSAMCNHTS